MIFLDENVIDSQRLLLQSWKIHTRQIGYEIGRKGMKDPEIIPFLHRKGDLTFFTRDRGFYQKDICHSKYCIVYMSISQLEVAFFIKRLLNHSSFDTIMKRLGKIVSVSHLGIRYWELNRIKKLILEW